MPTAILACVTFHFVAARLVWLRQVVECFSRYPVPVRLIVVTNTDDPLELAAIRAVAPTSGMARVEYRSFTRLADPFELTWCHKPIITDEFLTGAASHFIYAEDDILISPEAFAYWVAYRSLLQPRGLLPGFLRVEQADADAPLVASDQLQATRLDFFRMVRLKPWTFTDLSSPYTACFILDRDLAMQYASSKSFDMQASEAVRVWGVRERAAMGPAFEGVPRFFWSRMVVPFDRRTLQVPAFAHVVHAPGNYARAPGSPYARIPIDRLLEAPTVSVFLQARLRTALNLARSLARKIRLPA